MSKTAARQALRLFAARRFKHEVRSVSHVFPRAYVVAKVAVSCIVIAFPWQDAEPQVRDLDKECGGFQWCRDFDMSLKAGDWCAVGYVCMPGHQTHVAVPVSAPHKKRAKKR